MPHGAQVAGVIGPNGAGPTRPVAMVEEDNPVPEEVANALRDGQDIAEQMILSLADGEPFDALF